MLDTSNYYPFGLNHTGGNGLNSSGFGSWQSYKYNGKELQETGMYDFGARMYMADLGRWGVIDPLAEQMRRYSPYNFAFNNPVSFIDPDGMAPKMHQFSMPGDSRPDAYSGGNNPNWLGLGNTGGIETGGYGGGNSYSVLSSLGNSNDYLLDELFAAWAADRNISASFNNGNLIYWTGNSSFNGVIRNNEMYGDYELGVAHSIPIQSTGDIPLDAYKDWADWSATVMEGGFEYVSNQRTTLYNSGHWVDNLGTMRNTNYAGRARGSLIGLRSDYVRTTAMYGKYAKRMGMIGHIISVGEVGYGVYEDKWKFGKNAQVATASVAGGMAGAAAGAWALGKIGGGIGTFVGPEGTVVGATIGGIVGGIVGGVWGGEIAEGWAEDLL
ncbi:RHS repeat-associated core domain-containing protein [Chryseobacterium sp. 52]|uniref:RHS repeat-associated core domain-containing protein n=1 Tax=Chryseobacterium sp. 52 TaxID=2035213 RepID=UPI002937383F|nr:RHS repeat-associated core domain-containing protein [Chryseobacterium sp. 52]